MEFPRKERSRDSNESLNQESQLRNWKYKPERGRPGGSLHYSLSKLGRLAAAAVPWGGRRIRLRSVPPPHPEIDGGIGTGTRKKVDLKELVREREGEMRGESERGKLLACVAFVLLVR